MKNIIAKVERQMLWTEQALYYGYITTEDARIHYATMEGDMMRAYTNSGVLTRMWYRGKVDSIRRQIGSLSMLTLQYKKL